MFGSSDSYLHCCGTYSRRRTLAWVPILQCSTIQYGTVYRCCTVLSSTNVMLFHSSAGNHHFCSSYWREQYSISMRVPLINLVWRNEVFLWEVQEHDQEYTRYFYYLPCRTWALIHTSVVKGTRLQVSDLSVEWNESLLDYLIWEFAEVSGCLKGMDTRP